MNVFYALAIAHLLYDWHWQGEFIGVGKSSSNFLLIVHCLTWAFLIGGILAIYGYHNVGNVPFLYLTHFIVDFWKCRIVPSNKRMTNKILLADQVLHIMSIGVCLLW